MSSYNEFKQDVKGWTPTILFMVGLHFIFKIIVFIFTLGLVYFFKSKKTNNNYYKV
jgi:hypothetical protein